MAIVHVQDTGITYSVASGGSSSNPVLSGTPATGNWLIVCVAGYMGAEINVQSITGGGVTTWHNAFQVYDDMNSPTGALTDAEVWYGTVGTGSTSVTVTLSTTTSGGQNIPVNVAEFSGIASFDVAQSAGSNTSGSGLNINTNTIVTGASGLTPAGGGELFVAAGACNETFSTDPSGFTALWGSGNTQFGVSDYIVEAGSSAENPQWTVAGSSAGIGGAGVAAFVASLVAAGEPDLAMGPLRGY